VNIVVSATGVESDEDVEDISEPLCRYDFA
jgi:hypothetical protein